MVHSQYQYVRYAIYFYLKFFFFFFSINDHIVDENNDNKIEMFLHCVALSNKYFSVRLTCRFTTGDSFITFTLCLLAGSCNFQGYGRLLATQSTIVCHSLHNCCLESILCEYREFFS
jgi:hypothetical protein